MAKKGERVCCCLVHLRHDGQERPAAAIALDTRGVPWPHEQRKCRALVPLLLLLLLLRAFCRHQLLLWMLLLVML